MFWLRVLRCCRQRLNWRSGGRSSWGSGHAPPSLLQSSLVVGEIGLPHSMAALGQWASCRGLQDSGTSIPAHRGKWTQPQKSPSITATSFRGLCVSQPCSGSRPKGDLQAPREAFGMGQNNLPLRTDSRLQKQTYFRRQATSDGKKPWPRAFVVGN